MKFNVVAAASLAAAALVAASPTSSPLVRRGYAQCKNLKVVNNNGGRKIGIVIDSSGSMQDTDPYNLRILAGEQINDFLITSAQASGNKKADKVTVVDFDGSALLLYSLGDPSGASNKIFQQIDSYGDTFIAGGVEMAFGQLTAAGNDPTANRSGIVVLTDGEDYDTIELIDQINACGQAGIRVSFGFLTYDASYQDPGVLMAILATGGLYATIDSATAQNSFVNLMIAHGLTDDDNPGSNASSTLLNGLSIASTLDSSGQASLTYTAEANEVLTFSLTSLNNTELTATATDANGQELGKVTSTASYYSYYPEELVVTAITAGDMKIRVEGNSSDAGALFIVGVNSSIPLQNCTLDSGSSASGLSTGAKAGIGVAVPLIVGLLAAGSFFLWKYWKGIPGLGGSGAPPAYAPGTHGPPMTTSGDPSPFKAPMVQTDPVLQTPPPMNGSEPAWTSQPAAQSTPGWAIPPVPPPIKPGPKKDGDNLNQQDPNNQQLNHPPNGDPYHPSQADPNHPTQADPNHPTQADPYHPTQADPNPNHPTQADPNPNHPTQADPNPNDNSGHPPFKKFRFRFRRKKDDKEEAPKVQPVQPQQPQATYNVAGSTYPAPQQPYQGGYASPTTQYPFPAQGYPQPQQQPYQTQIQNPAQQQYAQPSIPQAYTPVGSPPPQSFSPPPPQPQQPYIPIASPQPQYPATSPPPQQQQYQPPPPPQGVAEVANVSPVQSHAQPAAVTSPVSPGQEEQGQGEQGSPIHRRPVGGDAA